MYSHTVRHPETVHSVVLIDSGSINLTFGVQAALYNWSSEDYDAAILWSLTERRRYLEAVNGLLLPFGLSGLTWDGIGQGYHNLVLICSLTRHSMRSVHVRM